MSKLNTVINVGKGKLGIDDATWRGQILPRFGGKPDADGRVSLNSLSERNKERLLAELMEKGFVIHSKNQPAAKKDWRKPRIDKLKALWAAMAQVGLVRSEGSLEAWAQSVTHTRKLEWAQSKSLNACIEGLKAWIAREGYAIRELPEHGHIEVYRA